MDYNRFEEEKDTCKKNCRKVMDTIFDDFERVFCLVQGFHDCTALKGIFQRSMDVNICKQCICENFEKKIMNVWLEREKDIRKLYVGFLRLEGKIVKIEPFVPISPCISSKTGSLLQHQFMYDWIINNSNTLLKHLKQKQPKLSWKWEKRGVNKLIIRIKPQP